MEDVEIKCCGCNEIFVLRSAQREYCLQRKIPMPRYCPICRKAYRDKKQQERKQQEDAEWRIKKEEEFRQYIEDLKDWNVVSLAEVEPEDIDKTLYVIGNGFDLMHGARSSYYDFSKTLGKNSQIRFYLENYLKAEDLWADFEGALAKINVEAMCSPMTIDLFLDSMGAYDEDAGAAEFFAATEMAAGPITVISTDLKKRFRKWICSLKTNTDDRPLKDIIKQGKVLDFNYTEFIEDLYEVDENDICYIHGCRRKKKGCPTEELVLGHMPGDSDSEYEFENQYSGIQLTDCRAQMIYDAQETALRFVGEADEELTKNCDKIIEKHRAFFEGLTEISRIITIGHSLYPVDWDYFKEIIRNNSAKDGIEWYFGCHGKCDLEHIQKFVECFGIEKDQVYIFRTDLISVSLSATDENVHKHGHNKPERKVLCSSGDGKWEIIGYGGKITIYDKILNREVFSRIFSTNITGGVFDDSNTCLFLVARGLYKGVFLLRVVGGKWKYVQEIEGIPNQGVITRRLNKIFLNGDRITFVYNNRIRGYDADNGKLVFNKQARRASESEFEGEDLTEKFKKIYGTQFY